MIKSQRDISSEGDFWYGDYEEKSVNNNLL